MKERYYGIVSRKSKVSGVTVDHSSLLWAIVQKAEDLDPHQVEGLVLGQLSPACPLAADLVGVYYPNDHGSDELLRHDRHNELVAAIGSGESILLSELLEMRLGTPESYSIVLAVALACHGHQVELAVTGPAATPPKHPFVVLSEQSIDLFWVANGGKPRSLRAHRKVKL
jgi:hypothetical protein